MMNGTEVNGRAMQRLSHTIMCQLKMFAYDRQASAPHAHQPTNQLYRPNQSKLIYDIFLAHSACMARKSIRLRPLTPTKHKKTKESYECFKWTSREVRRICQTRESQVELRIYSTKIEREKKNRTKNDGKRRAPRARTHTRSFQWGRCRRCIHFVIRIINKYNNRMNFSSHIRQARTGK